MTVQPGEQAPVGVERAPATALVPGTAQVTTALEALAGDLPGLPVGEHHDRYAAVLELLQRVLEGARPADDSRP